MSCRALWLSMVLVTALTACSREPQTEEAAAPANAPASTPATTTSTDTATAANSAEPQTTPSDSAAEASEAVPAVSETADEAEIADTGTQPPLRLGGPAESAGSSQFREGVHYTKLVPAQPTNVGPGKVEVVEVFWYGCGHCFALDPSLESWRTRAKPAYVEFVRVPALWNDTLRMHARLFYTAELLGKLEQLHSPIFREINVQNNPLNTEDRIIGFFRQHGVSPDEFKKAFKSFAVETKLQRAEVLNRRYRIESVPTIVINGKYVTDVGKAGGEQQLFALIQDLAAREHGG